MPRAITVTIALFVFLGGCLLGAAGTLTWPAAWIALGVYLASKVAALAFADREMIIERAAPGGKVDRVDQAIAVLGYLGIYPVTFIAAGIDAVRFGPALQIPLVVNATALVVFAAGYVFSTWAALRNPFFSTFVRIEKDRDHRVISSGPYALVRHPGYAGVLLAHLALPLGLGSIWALLPAILGIAFFVVRTAREDRLLEDQLDGYRAYQSRVRWRLLPGIW